MRLWLGKGLGNSADCATEWQRQLSRPADALHKFTQCGLFPTTEPDDRPHHRGAKYARKCERWTKENGVQQMLYPVYFFGRSERIRTFDPLHPMQVRYQAAPHTDLSLKL